MPRGAPTRVVNFRIELADWAAFVAELGADEKIADALREAVKRLTRLRTQLTQRTSQ